VWPNACRLLPQAFCTDDTIWLHEVENRRVEAAPSAGINWDSLPEQEEIRRMKKSEFEARWKEIRGKSREWWSLINDIDLGRLDKSPEKLKKYMVLLQVKYGYTRKFAGEEIFRRVAEYDAEQLKAPKS
jgi:L-rhamnose mutarotase